MLHLLLAAHSHCDTRVVWRLQATSHDPSLMCVSNDLLLLGIGWLGYLQLDDGGQQDGGTRWGGLRAGLEVRSRMSRLRASRGLLTRHKPQWSNGGLTLSLLLLEGQFGEQPVWAMGGACRGFDDPSFERDQGFQHSFLPFHRTVGRRSVWDGSVVPRRVSLDLFLMSRSASVRSPARQWWHARGDRRGEPESVIGMASASWLRVLFCLFFSRSRTTRHDGEKRFARGVEGQIGEGGVGEIGNGLKSGGLGKSNPF